MRSNPAADARLVRPPTEVRVSFTEPPDARASRLEVFDAEGRPVDRGDTRPSGEPSELVVSLEPIGEGGYTVIWTVLSTVDGHVTRGSFVFALGDAPLPELPDVGEEAPPPTPVELAGRLLSFVGTALVLGGAIFGTLVLRATAPAARRRERQLLAAGGALLAAGSALLVADQGAEIPQRLALLVGLRALAGAVALGLALAPLTPAWEAQRRLLLVAAGVAAALSLTLVSHAAASAEPVQVALDLAHVLAVSSWTGGLAALLWVALPALPVRDAPDARALGDTVARFSALAIASVVVLAVTGAAQSLQRLVLVQDLVETPYGLALLAKLALFAAVIALAALNLLVFGPRLRAVREPEAARRGLRRGALGETALLLGAFAASAFLTALAPPAQASGAAFDETWHVDGLRVQLLVGSETPGRNRFVLRVHEGLTPVDAQRVVLRFTMLEHDMGEQEIEMAQRRPGEYVAEASTISMYGTWQVEAIVRRTDRDDTRAAFSVPVAAPAGDGQLARVIPAPPYTLIVFSDPARPIAGAPFELNVVVVDAGGDPVGGKRVRATLEGPEPAEPLVADAPIPGRYVFAVDGLAAGSWQARLEIGEEATATYAFEVAR
ncbi:MAG TPA: CopD family protein [Candidatus Limnocylindrales bacterium]|nr:CopD family protein [Candidatus Limnocylindrales bacterium]